MFQIMECNDIDKAGKQKLIGVWERAVKETHTFLTEDDIENLKPVVFEAFTQMEHLLCAQNNDGLMLGFLGVKEDKVEMLFIDSTSRGQGVGKALLQLAVKRYGASKVDVNEQNQQAVGFYIHLGFRQTGRSETDEQGNPFPILHMAL